MALLRHRLLWLHLHRQHLPHVKAAPKASPKDVAAAVVVVAEASALPKAETVSVKANAVNALSAAATHAVVNAIVAKAAPQRVVSLAKAVVNARKAVRDAITVVVKHVLMRLRRPVRIRQQS